MKFNRLIVLFAALAFTTSTLAQSESLAAIFTNAANTHHTAILRRSSIIVIACHGLALGDLSCYGQTNFQTPNLDRLAAEGTRFTDYRAGGDDLFAAQAALMTGNNTAFSPGQTAFAARLQQAGYYTGIIGEWALGSEPWNQGFDEFAGFLNEQEADNYYSDFVMRYDPAGHYDKTNHTFSVRKGQDEIYENTGGRKGIFIPDLLMSATANFARMNAPDFANHYRPFFLLVSLPVPHSVTSGKDDYPVPTDAPYSGESWPQAAKNRAALLTRLDDEAGRLLERLKKLGMTNNVAIFLTGTVAPEKFADTNLDFLMLKDEVRGGSSSERLRVPMIVRWPGHVPAGRVSRAPWSAVDFAPTAMEIAHAKQAAGFTGISILPALLGQPPGANAPDTPPGLPRLQRQF